MEAVQTKDDGLVHIPGSFLADKATLCGEGMHGEFHQIEIPSFRKVTCEGCLDVVRISLDFSAEMIHSVIHKKK